MLTQNLDYSGRSCEHPQNHHLVRSRLSSRLFDAGAREGVSADDEEKFELSTKPSKQEKAAQGKSGFVPVARWVIERSNAWMERCKILVKNHERTLANATTKLNLCFVRLMVKRLAAS